MNLEISHMEILRGLLETQLLGVLGTQRDGAPYTSLVGFVATQDLKQLLFATGDLLAVDGYLGIVTLPGEEAKLHRAAAAVGIVGPPNRDRSP